MLSIHFSFVHLAFSWHGMFLVIFVHPSFYLFVHRREGKKERKEGSLLRMRGVAWYVGTARVFAMMLMVIFIYRWIFVH